MILKSYLIGSLLILINVTASVLSFYTYLSNGNPISMICGFISAVIVILIIIQLSKEL